jgi:hypothetical protein
MVNRKLFAARAQPKLVESARVNDGVAADGIAIGKKTAYDRKVISKEKGLAVRVVDVFGLYEKGTASMEDGFRFRKR